LRKTKNAQLAVQFEVYSIDPLGLSAANVVFAYAWDCKPSMHLGLVEDGGGLDGFLKPNVCICL